MLEWMGEYRAAVLFLCAVRFAIAAECTMLAPSLIPYVQSKGDVSDWEISLVGTAYYVMNFISVLLLGRFGKAHTRACLRAGLLLSSVGDILYVASNSVWLVLLARALSGLGGGVILIPQFYCPKATPAKSERSLHLVRMATFLGTIVGPLLSAVGASASEDNSRPAFSMKPDGFTVPPYILSVFFLILSFLEPVLVKDLVEDDQLQQLRHDPDSDFTEPKGTATPPINLLAACCFLIAAVQYCIITLSIISAPLSEDEFDWKVRRLSWLWVGVGLTQLAAALLQFVSHTNAQVQNPRSWVAWTAVGLVAQIAGEVLLIDYGNGLNEIAFVVGVILSAFACGVVTSSSNALMNSLYEHKPDITQATPFMLFLCTARISAPLVSANLLNELRGQNANIAVCLSLVLGTTGYFGLVQSKFKAPEQ